MICTDAAIVSDGRIVKRDRVANLLSSQETSVSIEVDDLERGLEVLSGLAFVSEAQQRDGILTAVCPPDAIAEVNTALVEAHLRVSRLARERLTLEDLYMELMQ